MGKNTQGHRGGSGPAQGGGDDVNPAATAAAQDGKVDGAFHSPAFLAAHIARLTSTDRVSWDDFKKKQTEDARKAALEAAQEDAATCQCAGRCLCAFVRVLTPGAWLSSRSGVPQAAGCGQGEAVETGGEGGGALWPCETRGLQGWAPERRSVCRFCLPEKQQEEAAESEPQRRAEEAQEQGREKGREKEAQKQQEAQAPGFRQLWQRQRRLQRLGRLGRQVQAVQVAQWMTMDEKFDEVLA